WRAYRSDVSLPVPVGILSRHHADHRGVGHYVRAVPGGPKTRQMVGRMIDVIDHSLKVLFLRRTQTGLHYVRTFAPHHLVQRYACRPRCSDGERGYVLMMTPHTSTLLEEFGAGTLQERDALLDRVRGIPRPAPVRRGRSLIGRPLRRAGLLQRRNHRTAAE